MKRILRSGLFAMLSLLLAISLSACGSSQSGASGTPVAGIEAEQSTDDREAETEGHETSEGDKRSEDDDADEGDGAEEETEGEQSSGQNQDASVEKQTSKRPVADSGSGAAAPKQKDEKKPSSAKNKKKSSGTSSQKGTSHSDTAKGKSPKSSKQEQEPKAQTITYSIVADQKMGTILSPTEVEIQDGDTVLDTLIKVTRDQGIHMAFRGGTGANAYVEGINNLYEFDRGQGSGWMYRVNGIFPNRGAGVIPVLPGDRVEWLYTIDLGKDLGADLKPFRQ